MGAYNFQDQFVPDIEADRKRHTIRAARKYPDKPGKLLYLYNKLRTKKARLLKIRRCVRVQHISIERHTTNGDTELFFVRIDGYGPLMFDEANQLARSDGFKNLEAMMEFWDGRLPFAGDLIHWESDVDAAPHEKEYAKIRAAKYKRKGN
jgi:hypothetical protein